MDLVRPSYTIHVSQPQALSPLSDSIENNPSQSSSSGASFPIIAVAVIGILATAFLLVSYYIFVIKCCLNWHRIDILRRFSLSRRRDEPLMVYAPAIETRGLDEAVIRSIPVFKFKKQGTEVKEFGERSSCECAVCLNEFQEDEKLRVIPNCSHVFHIDCIDVWLQGNANCPLCRTSISSAARFPTDPVAPPSSSPQDQTPFTEEFIGGDEDYVVIELRTDISANQNPSGRLERAVNSGELPAQVCPSPRKPEPRGIPKKLKKFQKVTSMGDECINTREKDEQFSIQPIRRSISMDSSADRQLYFAVQEALQRTREVTGNDVSPVVGGGTDGCSSSSRIRRSFFSFGPGRGSRSSAILPVYLDS